MKPSIGTTAGHNKMNKQEFIELLKQNNLSEDKYRPVIEAYDNYRFHESAGEVFEFSNLQWMTFDKVINHKNEELQLINSKLGFKVKLYHENVCCEDVRIEDICGDLEDLENTEILVAEEVSDAKFDDNGTWTFYIIRTMKGSVTVRWYGTSASRYYSEKVDCVLCKYGEEKIISSPA
jgi:hypothetical protein